MALNLLPDCTFLGPALPEPFVRFELEAQLIKGGLLPKATGKDGEALKAAWEAYRRKLSGLVSQGGSQRVYNHVVEPLAAQLGYTRAERQPEVQTREGREDGGTLLRDDGEGKLRVWAAALEEDLDAPARRGAAYRYSHVKIAQRVLLASDERLGLLTNGVELRLLISDPARPDSQIIMPIDHLWKRSREIADSFRLVLALATPRGSAALPGLVDQARLQQARVTKELRVQARQAIERFIQHVLDHPDNCAALEQHPNREQLARALWHEGLITVYRLLFVLKLEANDDAARAFSFASTSLWRTSFSPSVVLARYVRKVMDDGAESGQLLEDGLRALFRMFAEGLECSEMPVRPLGGALFGPAATPLLSSLRWGEHAVASLLDQLLWTTNKKGGATRERVHYGPLDVEDLGRVYEALLELEPGIAAEPMCRLRRQKLEVVVPLAQGQQYRAVVHAASDDADADEEEDEGDEEESGKGKQTRVEWIEEIQPGRFYLRVGLGRKASGSYYTPHAFVRFLVQETLGPQVEERSPKEDPRPATLLTLKVVDPAIGSGHFLVEACRFLGDKLYEACRLCDEAALAAEQAAEAARSDEERAAARLRALDFRTRVEELPDDNNEILQYLPSRAPEGQESGISRQKAMAICRRLVAVHCLYGVDKNPLAVELAKLSLWLESHAEGLPLTFLDHRLVLGDSLTGPFFQHLLTEPGSGEAVEDLFSQGLPVRFTGALADALQHVRDLEASVGTSLANVDAKQRAKERLDLALAPFKIVAAAWAGGVMLGKEGCDDVAYARLMRAVANAGILPESLADEPRLLAMIARGLGVEAAPPERAALLVLLGSPAITPALPYDLAFAEVFFRGGDISQRSGFDAVLGNPPWDAIRPASKEFFARYEIGVLDAPTARERNARLEQLLKRPHISSAWNSYEQVFEGQKECHNRLYQYQKVVVSSDLAGRYSDIYRVFTERSANLLAQAGFVGLVVPSAFHANEGATGIRQLYLNEMNLLKCYSFENRNKIFEIDSRFKFAVVIARKGGPTVQFFCAFYLHEPNILFRDLHHLIYSRTFVQAIGGDYLSFPELRSDMDLHVIQQLHDHGRLFHKLEEEDICFRTEPIALNVTTHGALFSNTPKEFKLLGDIRAGQIINHVLRNGFLVLQEGKYFNQFTDLWEDPPRYVVALEAAQTRVAALENTPFYRAAFRTIASATNERTAIFALLPPGNLVTNSVAIEATPALRSNAAALALCATANSFSFDFSIRIKAVTNMNLFIMRGGLVPRQAHSLFLAHAALRLTCNHAGYEALWREQVGEAWREPKPPLTWPVLGGDDERWAVRAAIDAVVAQAYGLSREQYEHVLGSFSHKSYPQAPQLCLALFDELTRLGLEAFTRRHDPYWDLPLNKNLPQPVIELPIPEAAPAARRPVQRGLFDERTGVRGQASG